MTGPALRALARVALLPAVGLLRCALATAVLLTHRRTALVPARLAPRPAVGLALLRRSLATAVLLAHGPAALLRRLTAGVRAALLTAAVLTAVPLPAAVRPGLAWVLTHR
ncbi:hypothetical protein GCM10027070_17630 [Barrientosiimonas humi]